MSAPKRKRRKLTIAQYDTLSGLVGGGPDTHVSLWKGRVSIDRYSVSFPDAVEMGAELCAHLHMPTDELDVGDAVPVQGCETCDYGAGFRLHMSFPVEYVENLKEEPLPRPPYIGAEVTDGYITGEVTEIIPAWFDEDPGFVVRLVADMTFEDVDLEGRSVTTTTVKKGEKVIRGENDLQVVS